MHRGEKAVGRLGQFQGNPRVAVALVGEAPQPGFLGGNDGNLRHRENAVRDQQQKDDGNFKGNLTHEVMLTALAPNRKA